MQWYEQLAAGLGQGLSNMLESAYATGQYSKWKKKYAPDGTPSQFKGVPYAMPENQLDETAMAELVSALGSNPFGKDYLQSADLMYQQGQRRQQEAEKRRLEAKQEDLQRRQIQAAQNEAMMRMYGGLGMVPAQGAIPQIAESLMGSRPLPQNYTEQKPLYGPPQPGQEMGTTQVESPAWQQTAPKVEMLPGQYEIGGQMVLIGRDEYGNLRPMPLPQGLRPYEKPTKGGEKDVTWSQEMDLANVHADRSQAGKDMVAADQKYREAMKLPTRMEIGAAMADSERAQKLNQKYGPIFSVKTDGTVSIIPGTTTREEAQAQAKEAKRQAEQRLERGTERLKSASRRAPAAAGYSY